MIETIIAAIVVVGLLFAGMAVGVIFSNKPIKGSCGGLNALGMKEDCEICGGDQNKCDSETDKANKTAEQAAQLSYDANQR